jgi:hypothetical protein
VRTLRPDLLAITLCSLVTGLLFAWTYGTWADLTVDFGREVYVPWQLSRGTTLYQGVAHFNGPVSPYFNAAVFAIFGASLHTLVFTNLTLFVLTWLMLYAIARHVVSTIPAACATLSVILLCGFLQLMDTANYNFITPYSHELTHGVTLSVAVLLLLARWTVRRATPWLVGIGALIGIQLLTKPEVSIATIGAVAVAILLAEPRRVVGRLAIVLTSSLLAPGIAFALLATRLPAAEAFHGIAGAWAYLFDARVREFPFYRWVMGTDDLPGNLFDAGLRFAVTALVLAIAWVIALRRARPAGWLMQLAIAAFIVVSLVPTVLFEALRIALWGMLPLGWIVLVPMLTLLFLPLPKRKPTAQQLVLIATGVLASLLLLKILLRVSVAHYGFALALPALFFVVLVTVGVLPARVDARRPGCGWVVRVPALSVLLVFIASHLVMTHTWTREKSIALTPELRVDPRSPTVRQAIQAMRTLRAQAAPGQTLAVMPEGAMLNVLTGMTNPTPFIVTMPVEVAMFDQAKIAGAFERSPPDWVIVRRYSLKLQYGVELWEPMPDVERFVSTHYTPIGPIDESSRVVLLKRRDSSADAR